MSTVGGSVAGGLLGGAGQGAAAGAMVGGPVGAVIGAIVGGIVGTVGGVFSGNKAKRAEKYAKMAAQVQKQREENSMYDQYLQYIRQARIMRAQSVQAAANTNLGRSSLFAGAVSGMGSQIAYSTQFAAEDYMLNNQYNEYMSIAGKNAEKAKEFSSLANSAATLGATFAAMPKDKKPQTQEVKE